MMIFYTGVGAKKNGKHSPAEFMKVVRSQLPQMVLMNMKIQKNGTYKWMRVSPATAKARIVKFRKYTVENWAKEFGAVVRR